MDKLNMAFIRSEIERKLNPCKRCGSKSLEFHGNNDGDCAWIFCRNCGLVFEPCFKGATPERVVQEWNRRAENG